RRKRRRRAATSARIPRRASDLEAKPHVMPSRHRSLLALAVCLASAAALAACTREPAAPPNVVLVLADTTRADRLGLYGYARDTTPNLNRLARDAVVFEQARSQASCTFPSVNSILTSK